MPLNLHLHELQRISMRCIFIPHSRRNPRTIWSVGSGAAPPLLQMSSCIPLPFKGKEMGKQLVLRCRPLFSAGTYTCGSVDPNYRCEKRPGRLRSHLEFFFAFIFYLLRLVNKGAFWYWVTFSSFCVFIYFPLMPSLFLLWKLHTKSNVKAVPGLNNLAFPSQDVGSVRGPPRTCALYFFSLTPHH